jgi:hypothetical protein
VRFDWRAGADCGVCIVELIASFSAHSCFRALLSAMGVPLPLWPLFNNVYPVPQFPDNLWPYIVEAWVVTGVALRRKILRAY